MNFNDQKVALGAAAVALVAMYGSYLYGQKNPDKRNALDMTP